jgi:hypothetical protein
MNARLLCTVEGRVTYVERFKFKDGREGLSVKICQAGDKGDNFTVNLKFFKFDDKRLTEFAVGNDVIVENVDVTFWSGGLNLVCRG